MATRLEFKGDYLGFSFNGLHSSDFNIVRVINGDRSELDLSPPINVEAMEVPKRHGAFYTGTTFKPRDLNVSFAFDGLTEVEVSNLKTWLKPDVMGWLIFDEVPYKQYKVVIAQAPKIKYLGFDENSTRVVKGEGELIFRCYDPFAHSVFRTLNQYSAELYPNKSFWAESSGMKESLSSPTLYDSTPDTTTTTINLYNPGDIDTPLSVKSFVPLSNSGYFQFVYNYNSVAIQKLALDLSKFTIGSRYVIDGERKIIYLNSTPNVILNHAIVAGDFIKIKPSRTIAQNLQLVSTSGARLDAIDNYKVHYDYLYY